MTRNANSSPQKANRYDKIEKQNGNRPYMTGLGPHTGLIPDRKMQKFKARRDQFGQAEPLALFQRSRS